MNEQMSKGKILELTQRERAALEATLESLTPEQLTAPGVEGDWSVKDLLAHIAAWEGMMVQWIEQSLRGEVPERPAPGITWDDLDELNARLFEENKDRLLDQVLAEFGNSFQRALKRVKALTEQDLIDPQRFEWRKGDPLWHMVAANTWWHYKEHREAIDNWLKEGNR